MVLRATRSRSVVPGRTGRGERAGTRRFCFTKELCAVHMVIFRVDCEDFWQLRQQTTKTDEDTLKSVTQ